MSLPWLSKKISGSRSPPYEKPRAKVDKFGRSLPQKSKSRSRSHSRSSSRDRSNSDYTSSRHSRESSPKRRCSSSKGNKDRNDKTGSRSHRRRDSSSSSSKSSSSDSTRIVASDKPKYLNARVFVANINSKEITREDLVKHFEKYGEVIDVLVHPKNYAFIQYTKVEHAQLAVEGENGSTLNGWRLDVKMAKDNRKGGENDGKSGGRVKKRGERRGGRGRHGDGPFSSMDVPPYPGPVPFIDPFYGGRLRPPVPFPGDYRMRDPFYPDPFRRGYPDPWLADDPYRRGMFPDPYNDVYESRSLPPPVIECEIFVINSQLRAYGEAVELRVKEHSIITAVSITPEGRTNAQLVEELTAHSTLFAIFINTENEMHRSLTLNILHGVPQEHRNMPLDDAIALIGKSFVKYVQSLRDKAQDAATPLPSSASSSIPRVFLPATPEVAYLLNLLADNRALTVAELETVIRYLQERRDKLVDAESRPLLNEESFIKSPSSLDRDASQTSRQEPLTTTGTKKEQTSLTQDLTSKILSLFGSTGNQLHGVPPANGTQPAQGILPIAAPAPLPPPPPHISSSSSASLINFDNPNVQKALDNLIQSTSILKNINPKPSLTATPVSSSKPDTSSVGMMSGSSNSRNIYGQVGEMIGGHSQGQVVNNQNVGFMHDSYGTIGQGLQGSVGMYHEHTLNVQGGQEYMGGNLRLGSAGNLPQGQGLPGGPGLHGGSGLHGQMGTDYGFSDY